MNKYDTFDVCGPQLSVNSRACPQASEPPLGSIAFWGSLTSRCQMKLLPLLLLCPRSCAPRLTCTTTLDLSVPLRL
jgi:hypothetical protein